MKEREIQVTADQIHKLIAEVRALPGTPVGDHLSDDEFIGYTMETLEPQQMERVDGHLASCPECATEMERLVEASEVWHGEQGEQRLAELEARTRAVMDTQSAPQPSIPQKIADLLKRWWQSHRVERRPLGDPFRKPGSAQYQVIRNITRDLLEKLAPHELPLFPPISDAYFRDPQAVFAGRGNKEDMLGFGLETSEVLLTPVALAVVTELVQLVGQRATDTVKEEETTLATLRLGPEQLSQIHKRAFEMACQLKLTESQARSLADALMESLTVIDS